jgi:hypothetical protein
MLNIAEFNDFEGYPHSIADTAGFLATLDMVYKENEDDDEDEDGLDLTTKALTAIELLQDGGEADDNAIQMLDSYCHLIASDVQPLSLPAIALLCNNAKVPFFQPDATPSLARLLKSTVSDASARERKRTEKEVVRARAEASAREKSLFASALASPSRSARASEEIWRLFARSPAPPVRSSRPLRVCGIGRWCAAATSSVLRPLRSRHSH